MRKQACQGRYRDAQRTFGNQLVTHMDRVLPGSLEGLAQAERAFVDVEPKLVAIGRQRNGLAGYAAI